MGLFGRRKKQAIEQKISDIILMEQLTNDDNETVTHLAKQMIEGTPLILNFESLDIDGANKVISFLSGVVYAIHGHIFEINAYTYLFGNAHVYDDGSIQIFLDNL